MIRDRGSGYGRTTWALLIGAASGLAAGIALSRWGALGERIAARRDMARTETQLREALAADSALARRELDVGVVADGIVELIGTVRDEEEAERAVAVAQRIPGVRTVLNRLDHEMLEEHLAGTRQRLRDGDPSLLETHWYGMRVGTGQRRQSRWTDPDRPSERVPMLERELGTNLAVEQASEPLDKIPSGVEGHTTVPAAPTDRGTVGDVSHGRLGNVPREPIQEMHAEARIHENIKPGTELTLEESGLDTELRGRELEERG